MKVKKNAVILIGFQNDYFGENGVLREVVAKSIRVGHTLKNTLKNTLDLIESIVDTNTLIISTPLIFTGDYRELQNPVGILKTIRDVGAFRRGTEGARTIEQIERFGNRIVEVPGKTGLNAFSNTDLDEILVENGVTDVVVAGAVTSVCIDSTARSASERGYSVTVLSDCTVGRSDFEQQFYCEHVFPIYVNVCGYRDWVAANTETTRVRIENGRTYNSSLYSSA